MSKRRKIAVGNWKMNGRLTSGLNLVRDLVEKASMRRPLPFDVVVCPPATILWPLSEIAMGTQVFLGGQDCHTVNHGAYTGDISAGMLADLGCRYVILGHSERRSAHGESNELVAQKVAAAQLAGLTAILCVGESKEARASGQAETAIVQQLAASLPEKVQSAQLIIAYEPIWAIGTGIIPTLDEIRTIHRLIRRTLGSTGEAVQVVYGGSVSTENATELLAEQEIDGVLVGNASLNSDGFWAIAEKCGQG